ncbi:unnamed protein product [Didymodactylos carnosus]|uniref:G-protein coupled receptors family 1 profile domain-containing protein n=1 Tax=Didymodactylos carnosus TaxID=1234261 RepID=A0A814ZT00_9BILA|nr:unnamed protein product [Didymodactylos carnosus]CAF1245864.1 unnamed protein product [Didymodactylos carnosus]CAF3974187.1 unnamed protein product [Didymodactylos carnosus]CAF4011818.1 unnamed protein product [Didymodactylos carnosus]
MIVIKGVHFDKVRSKQIAKYMIITVILMNILGTLHEPFYRHMVDDPHINDYSWCVIKYPYVWLETYETIINITNLLVPFMINFITTLIVLILLARRKSSIIDNNKSYFHILKDGIRRYNSFVISPLLLILLELPRLVSSFAFACITFQWQKYLYLTSYFVSTLPLMTTLLIFVIPKESYKKELIDCLKRSRESITGRLRKSM